MLLATYQWISLETEQQLDGADVAKCRRQNQRLGYARGVGLGHSNAMVREDHRSVVVLLLLFLLLLFLDVPAHE